MAMAMGPTGAETRVSVAIADNVITTDYVAILHHGRLLTMPHAWVENFFAELQPGNGQSFYHSVFSNCSLTMQRLPSITLTFPAGRLHLIPEDYTRPTGQDDTCELLIDTIPAWAHDQRVGFNPLLIPGINARSTENEIILCDSAIDPTEN
jgi:hypothetical protein